LKPSPRRDLNSKSLDEPMSVIVESWKKHTSNKANRLLKRKGAFWASGYFDTYMRGAEHEQTTIRYIENNPTKAKLVLDPKDWPWSSARFRDEFGALKLWRIAAVSQTSRRNV
jgi:hypothetical protein